MMIKRIDLADSLSIALNQSCFFLKRIEAAGKISGIN